MNNEFTSSALSAAEASLCFWTKESFQGFLESGLVHDFIEASKDTQADLSSRNVKLILLEIFKDSKPCDCQSNVSLAQALKILSIAPSNNATAWNKFFGLVNSLGLRSGWFSHHKTSWAERDVIRVAIGLESINKIYKQEYPFYTHKNDVFLIKTGHCAVWVRPPAGYRYAELEEVPTQAVKDLDLVVVYVHNFGWARLGTEGEDVKHDGVVAHNFFHNNVFYVPLIRIK